MEPLTLAALATGALYLVRRYRAKGSAAPAGEPPKTSSAAQKGPAVPPSAPATPPSVPQGSDLANRVEFISAVEGSGDGLAWAKSLPSGSTPEREAKILQAVKDGMARFEWVRIPLEANGVKATLPVMSRVLRIGKTNPVRVSVNYATAQAIADHLGAAMMTPHVADLTRLFSRVPLAPSLRNNWVQDGTMSGTNRMIEYSQALDAKVPENAGGIVSNEGKHWVNTLRFWNDKDPAKRFPPNKRSANYGWWDKGAPNKRYIGNMWQTTGLVHDWAHVDYSQLVQLMGQKMNVEGVGEVHVGAALSDPKLFELLSDEGPLPSWAHPGFQKPPQQVA